MKYLIFSIIIFSLIVGFQAEASPGWLADYGYRKQITIDGTTAGAQTNYQMKLIVHKGIGTDSSSDVYLNNHSQDDFDDILFTKSDEVTELDYWRESYVFGDYAVFWIKFNSIPASPSSAAFYIYYDNPLASSASNGENTFEFFDDFSGSILDTGKWQQLGGGSPSLLSGELTISANNTDPSKLIAKTAPSGDYYVLRAKFKASDSTDKDERAGVSIKTGLGDAAGYNYVVRDFDHLDEIKFLDDLVAWGDKEESSWAKDTWYTFEIYHNGTTVKGRRDDGAWKDQSPNWQGRTGYPALNIGSKDAATVWDFAAVRKIVMPEPAWASWGSEEEFMPCSSNSDCSGSEYCDETQTCQLKKSMSSSCTLADLYYDPDGVDSVCLSNDCLSGACQGGWLSGWNYRRTIIIDNTSNPSALIDYQVKIDVAYDPNMQSDLDDLRLTDEDGATKLNYWLEDISPAAVWVKVPVIPASSQKIIYLYYGNPSALSESNGPNTFEFFDDFSVDTSGNYVVVGAGTKAYDSTNKVLKQTSTAQAQHWIVNAVSILPNAYVYQADVKIVSDPSNRNHAGLATDFSTSAVTGYRLTHLDAKFPVSKWSSAGSETSIGEFADGGIYADNKWLTERVYRNRASGLLKYEITDGAATVSGSYTDTTHTTGRLGFHSYGSEAWYDNIRVRKYAYPEPTVINLITTNAATNITKTTATLNGNLGSLSGEALVEVWFEWGQTVIYGNTTSPQTKTAPGSFSADISDLSTETTYHFRAVAKHGEEINYGSDKSFAAKPQYETFNVIATCSDADANLSQCNVTAPCAASCSASGSSGSCSCQFTCTVTENYDACGEAIDARGSSDITCAPAAIQCEVNLSPDKPVVPPGYASNGVSWDHCIFRGKSIPTFHWTYSDPDSDPQTAYEIWVDDNMGFPNPKFNNLVNLAATAYVLNLSQDDESDWLETLAWDTTYYWKVRVKDDHGNWSEWSDVQSFTTPLHAYPWPDFAWLPQNPNQEEVVVFDPEEENVYYLWTVTEGEGVYTDETGPTNEEPHIKFLTSTNRIKLKVTDSDAYFCESSPAEGTLLEAQLPLPEYKEVAPIAFFKKMLAAVVDFFY